MNPIGLPWSPMGCWPLLALQVLGAADPDLWQCRASQEKWSDLQPRWLRLQFNQFRVILISIPVLAQDKTTWSLMWERKARPATLLNWSSILSEPSRGTRGQQHLNWLWNRSYLSHPNHHWQKWSDLIQGPLRWGCGQKRSCSSVLSPQSGRNGQAAFHGW